MTPRFTIDHGTASTSAALIAPLDGRWRLLAAASMPRGVEVEALLAWLVEGAARSDPSLAAELPGLRSTSHAWRGWTRLEGRTAPPRRIALVAPTERRLGGLEAVAMRAGWIVVARITPERADALEATAMLSDRRLDAIALAAGDPPSSDERTVLPELAALAAAIAGRRELSCLLVGGALDEAARFPAERVVLGTAVPEERGSAAADPTVELLVALGGEGSAGRIAFGRAVASLATVLERRIEGLDIGYSGGAWFRADPRGRDGFVLAEAALVPEGIGEEDARLDAILAWSPSRADRPTQRDRLRDLHLAPWRDAAGEGAVMRMTAARAAIVRLEAARLRFAGPEAGALSAPDLVVAAGGAFAPVPGPAVALALADTIRRAGMTQLAYDHARLLGPLGALDDEQERRVLIADLAEDLLLPLGSALVVQGLRAGRDVGRLRVTGDGATVEQPLTAGTISVVDLPAGVAATAEVGLREGFAGARARRLAFEAVGGLGGLLVDTRDVPLRLPDRAERRREILESWQRSFWVGGDAWPQPLT